MGLEAIVVAEVIPATPERIYQAWMDAKEHSKLTGGEATVDARVGGGFTAWDGYIRGVTEELVPGERIAQRWRSTDFPQDAGDSKVVVTFAPDAGGALVTIEHTEIPEGQGESYKQGWVDYYFVPMKKYFGRVAAMKKLAAAKKAPVKKAVVKKAAAAKKAAPVKAAAAKKGAAKKAAPAKKAAAKKKAVAKKAAPAKKAAAKKAARAKKAASKA